MNGYIETLKKYVAFSGRASRREFWMFTLINFVIGFVLSFITGIIDPKGGLSIVGTLFQLAVLLPSIAVGVRRMHDTDRPGWWIIVPILDIIYAIQEGTKGDNKYGPDPLVAVQKS